MPKRSPRPRLREGVGQARAGRGRELSGPTVVLEEYDLPLELAGAGRIQWLQFAANPMTWWTEADLPTIAQYCAALDAVDRARTGSPAGWAAASREVRALADALGLTPMARARMGLRKSPHTGGIEDPDSGSGDDTGADPAEVIPFGSLVDDDGNPQ